MIRHLNFTGRRKIPRGDVSIRLEERPGADHAFSVSLSLDDMKIPRDAKVFVEAYREGLFMRFAFGTAGSIKPPADTTLSAFGSMVVPLFRVKVVGCRKDYGQILASVDRIVPLRPHQGESERIPLLPVEFREMGQRVWELDLADGPMLMLNKGIVQLGGVARADASFLALVHPEILRQVLAEILFEQDQNDPDSDEDDWMCNWLKYARDLTGRHEMPPADNSERAIREKSEWIDRAVSAFCEIRQVRSRFEQELSAKKG